MSNKPIWTEGLLLSQHHFQQQDLYHEALLNERLQAVTHYDWGVTSLEVDEVALRSGQFKIRRLVAIWPDGTSVGCGQGTDVPAPAPRPIDTVFTAAQSKLEVYVGLAHQSETSAAVADADTPDSPCRYVSVTREVLDVTTGGNRQEVELGRPNLRIFLGSERRDGFSTIQVAELGRHSNGQPILRDNYVPPVLHLRAAPFLRDGLQRVMAAVSARQRELAGDRRQRDDGSVVLHVADTRKFWLLHTLNGAIPGLSHLLETERTHPEEVYAHLTRLVGYLCTFHSDVDPLELPKFNYLALGEVFEPLFAKILSMLPGGIEQAFVEIDLKRREDGMFLGKLPDPDLVTNEFFVAIQSQLDQAVVRQRIPEILRMASWADIENVVRTSVYGVRTEVEWSPSAVLPLRPGVCFFRVRRQGKFWDGIAKTRSIALHLPIDADWRGASISLYAVNPAKLR